MKNINPLNFIIMIFMIVIVPPAASAIPPHLNFSDLNAGPRIGLTDDKVNNQGAIVTIWGNNLGSTQATSKVYIGNPDSTKVEAAYVYYWCNADRKSGGGPSDLYKYHKMQEIAFAISSNTPTGNQKIWVEVDGVISNTIDFEVWADDNDNDIYFVKTTGDDTNTGSWSSPWQTLDRAGIGPGRGIGPGDIIYICDGVTKNGNWVIGLEGELSGVDGRNISAIVYPGATVICDTNGGSYGITHWDSGNQGSHWNFSKFIIETNSVGISGFKHMRAVGNEITDCEGCCSDGQAGALHGGGVGSDRVSGIKAFGNYIHDFGCDNTSKFHHVFYYSNRSGTALEPFEIGWNHLSDNGAYHGLHVYDEGNCGDFTGAIKIHHNAVINQRGIGFGVGSSGSVENCYTMDVEMYNNLIVNAGRGPGFTNTTFWVNAIALNGSTTKSYVKIYNNTIYGYGDPSVSNTTDRCAIWLLDTYGGQWEFKNNIVVDTNNEPYYKNVGGWKNPISSSNNAWYNMDDGNPASPPSWDTNPITSDPLFNNPDAGDFRLQQNSPCKNTGTDTGTDAVDTDISGVPRTGKDDEDKQPDIGAFEYVPGGVSYFAVTFSAGAHGTLDGSKSQAVYSGGSCTAVTAVPDTGYQFGGWSGDYTGSENPLTVTNVTQNMSITANFVTQNSDGDTDGDGVDSTEEMGFDGDDATYDGNNDDTPDYLQNTVASFKTLNEFGSYLYVTLAASADGNTVTIEVNRDPDDPLVLGGIPEEGGEDVAFPYGFFEFTVTCSDCSGTSGEFKPIVTLYLPEGSVPNTYQKYGPTPDNESNHWYKFMSDDLIDVGADLDDNIVTLHFIDGDTGDDDLDDSNGVVVDIGGPGISTKN